MDNKQQSIVDDHRNMLMLSKKVSTFQEENLKSWAFLFFSDLKELEVRWDFIRKNKSKDFFPGKVSYNLKFPKEYSISDEEAKVGLDRLEACVKFLFWSETQVNIKKNGKTWITTN